MLSVNREMYRLRAGDCGLNKGCELRLIWTWITCKVCIVAFSCYILHIFLKCNMFLDRIHVGAYTFSSDRRTEGLSSPCSQLVSAHGNNALGARYSHIHSHLQGKADHSRLLGTSYFFVYLANSAVIHW